MKDKQIKVCMDTIFKTLKRVDSKLSVKFDHFVITNKEFDIVVSAHDINAVWALFITELKDKYNTVRKPSEKTTLRNYMKEVSELIPSGKEMVEEAICAV